METATMTEIRSVEPGARREAAGLREATAAWLGWAATTALLTITYARIAPAKLYNVSHSGLMGGLGRAVVQLNFPVGLAAIAIAGVLAARLRQMEGAFVPGERRLVAAGLIVGALLCAVVAGPGVVRQSNLDARWINAPAALGVLLIAALTVAIARRSGLGSAAPFGPGDRVRLGLALALILVALPWLFAEAGVYIGRIPGLGRIFLSEQIRPGETEAAVHLGHHHGADGLYLALTALLLSRVLPRIGRGALKAALGFYLGLMLAYGIANMANDAWTEQVWKRGWTNVKLPNFLTPSLSLAWAGLLIAAVAIALFIFPRLAPAS
jgi:hypothetical protein